MGTLASTLAASAILMGVVGCGRTGLDPDATVDGGADGTADTATPQPEGGDARGDAAPLGPPDAGAAEEASTPPWEMDAGLAPDAACTGKLLPNGRCLVRIASGQEYPWGVAIDATNVYWVNQGKPGETGTGAIMKAPRGGGRASAVVSGLDAPHDLATDGVDVFWTGKVLSAVSVNGGQPRTIFYDHFLSETGIVIRQGKKVYWIDNDSFYGLHAAFPDGTGHEVISERTSIGGVAPSTTGIVYTEYSIFDGDPQRVKSRAFDGTTAVLVESKDAVDSPQLVASAKNVVVYTGQVGGLSSVPLAGGAPTFLANRTHPGGIATDGTYLYFTDRGQGGVVRAPLGDGAPELLVGNDDDQGVYGDGSIAIDAASVYFTDEAGYVFRLWPR